jgi:hypothetical protein
MEKPPKIPKTAHEKEQVARLYVVLEMAPLETIKVGSEYRLANSDDHAHVLMKNNKDPADYR